MVVPIAPQGLKWQLTNDKCQLINGFLSYLAHAYFPFRLNIFSIRSVITNPPTTFVVEQTTAMKPRIVLTLL
jgi:hypothetical protein